MSAVKKIAGLVAGFSAVGVIGVAVAQGVPPNPHVSNPALGAGEQTVNMTPIGETGVLAWSDNVVQPVATLTPQDEQAAVASPPAADNSQPVASSDTTSSSDTSQQVAQAPANDNNQSMGAGPASSDETGAPRAARHDRG